MMNNLYNQHYSLISFSGINLAVNRDKVVNVAQASSVKFDTKQNTQVGQLVFDTLSHPTYALDEQLLVDELTKATASSTFCVLFKNTNTDSCFGLIGESVSQLELNESEVVITAIPDYMKAEHMPVQGICRLAEQTIMIIDPNYLQSFILKQFEQASS